MLKKYDEKAQAELKKLWLDIDTYKFNEKDLDKAISALKYKKVQKYKFGNELNMQKIYQNFISNLSIINEYENKSAERIMYNLGMFSKIIADYEYFYFNDNPKDKLRKFNAYLENIGYALYSDGMEKNIYIRGDAVNIMSIHQSEGLEFTAVFMIGLREGIFPDMKNFDSKGKIYGAMDVIKASWIPKYEKISKPSVDSERKLFYGGVTRAKKYLFLTGSVDNGCKKLTEESIFLKEVKKSKYIKEHSDKYKFSNKYLPTMDKENVPIVLNFSNLSDYFDCPYRYKLTNATAFKNFYGFTLTDVRKGNL